MFRTATILLGFRSFPQPFQENGGQYLETDRYHFQILPSSLNTYPFMSFEV
jgi:hypothetical protein